MPKSPDITIQVKGPGAKEIRHKLEETALHELDAFGKEPKDKGRRLARAMLKKGK